MASYHDEIDNLYREADKYGEKRSDFNDDVLKQSGESEKILGLGEDENRKQQGEFNSGRSGSSSNKDISRFGAARLTDDPNARKSKDDTIYDSPEIEDLFDDYEDSGMPDEVDPRDPYGRTTGQMIDDENFELNALLDKALKI